MHGGVYFRMTEEFLHLLNGHALFDGVGGEGSPELMRVNTLHFKLLSQFAKTEFNGSDGKAIMGVVERHKERRIVVAPVTKVVFKV